MEEDSLFFKETEYNLEWDGKKEEQGKAGYPSHAKWLCRQHCNKALKLKCLTITKTLRIKKKF